MHYIINRFRLQSFFEKESGRKAESGLRGTGDVCGHIATGNSPAFACRKRGMKNKNPANLSVSGILCQKNLLGSAGNLSGDFRGEVVSLLLDALALDVVNSVNKGHLAASFLAASAM